uniref:Uncharacterized protein n=1 Tax=Utricularia reniformis TaxID=192314 RepID=A0A1Y0AZK3_9LAMI|nr:hypothetical protein AEK19_MT0333 [Utricularia reniformis]ART30605.1 hypothetical protein AEK19_MT0333 [Utricularia reniformis]
MVSPSLSFRRSFGWLYYNEFNSALALGQESKPTNRHLRKLFSGYSHPRAEEELQLQLSFLFLECLSLLLKVQLRHP